MFCDKLLGELVEELLCYCVVLICLGDFWFVGKWVFGMVWIVCFDDFFFVLLVLLLVWV